MRTFRRPPSGGLPGGVIARNNKNYSSPVRESLTGGIFKNVRPDGVAPLVIKITPIGGATYAESVFYEVKAVTNKKRNIMLRLPIIKVIPLISSFSTIITLNIFMNSAFSQNINMNTSESAPQQEISEFQPPLEAKQAFELGRQYDAQNLSNIALEQYNKAIELFPNYAEAYLARSVNLSFNNAQQAIKDAQKALEIYKLRGNKNAISAVNSHIDTIKRGIAEGVFKN